MILTRITLLLSCCWAASAYSIQQPNKCQSRRAAFGSAFGAALGVSTAILCDSPAPAVAAGTNPPSPEELSRVKKGYDGIVYLLGHWEQETTTCRDNGGECKRNAEPVRRYLGLRSTTDPLFQVEKIFGRVKYMDIDIDKLEGFFEAAEDWNSAMNMSNSMAFISQFGEYNPGGGKDEVLKYLNEAEIQVKLAKKSLETIMDVLDIEYKVA